MAFDMLFDEHGSCDDVVPERGSVLIIEDDQAIRGPLAMRLARQGFAVRQASTGQAGLAMASEQTPDVVLLDLRLPDADGFTICRTLDEHPQTCGTPVIIVSGMEGPDIVRRSRAAGCRFYVRKPYDPDALLVLIEQALLETV